MKPELSRFSQTVIIAYSITICLVIGVWCYYLKAQPLALFAIFIVLYLFCFHLIRRAFKKRGERPGMPAGKKRK